MTDQGRPGLRDEPRTACLLAVGDDELVLGHRHSHWTGVAPSLEEDLAFATISQDGISHADLWYQVLVGPDRAAVDAVGLGRQPGEYRHAVLVERPPRDFGHTLARHFLYERFDAARLRALAASADAEVAAVARKVAHEKRYHRTHTEGWLERIARVPGEPADRLADALRAAWPEALWLFEPVPGEKALVDRRFLPVPTSAMVAQWLEDVVPVLQRLGYGDVVTGVEDPGGGPRLPEGFFAEPGGRHGVHTPDFTDDVWPEMTHLYRTHPGARW